MADARLMLSQPRPPLESWPVQHRDDSYGFAWYCRRGIIVSQVIYAHGSAAAAHNYHRFEEQVLRDRAAELERYGGLFVVHDWRAMQTYDAEARRVWQDRMRERDKGYLRGSVVCVAKAGALLKMAVQAANVITSVVHGVRVELSEDLEGVLREHAIEPPI
ncbi:MAG TPA: hypothetical protein VFN67_33015 [Polyangiales bacterium]|nr:hypothetical protein [Polyangiales bacterium]